VRVPAIRRVRVRRRILRRPYAVFCAASRRAGVRLAEVIVGRLVLVLPRDVFTVAQPVADNVRWETLGQFRLPAASHVVEQTGLFPPRPRPFLTASLSTYPPAEAFWLRTSPTCVAGCQKSGWGGGVRVEREAIGVTYGRDDSSVSAAARELRPGRTET